MSYTPQDFGTELTWAIHEALHTRDSEALLILARELKKLGEDEEADRLRLTAKKIRDEDDYHDQVNT